MEFLRARVHVPRLGLEPRTNPDRVGAAPRLHGNEDFGVMFPRLIHFFQPASLLEIGCGLKGGDLQQAPETFCGFDHTGAMLGEPSFQVVG